ncbi:MAG: TolC family protein [Rikenellaceae bacterium]
MKAIFLLSFFFLTTAGDILAQTSLEYCYERAELNYPLIDQRGLIEKSREYTLKNAKTAYYPQIGFSIKASFQSDVTTMPMPGIESIPKDQYQATIEVDQSIWDGGMVRAERKNINATSEVDLHKLKVDLYGLRERVNNLFFGIIMLSKKLEINALLNEELQRNLQKVKSYVSGGIANSADVDAVQVEILNNSQNRIALISSRKAYCDMLSAMVGQHIDSLVTPTEPLINKQEICRPELSLFDSQIIQAEAQKKGILARNMPKLGVFVQGAYGNPGLDMLKAGFTPYAIGGVRLKWNFGGFYTQKHDISNIEIRKQSIETQRATFLYNTNLSITQIGGDVERIVQQMKDDEQIIKLRGNIKRSSEAKVEGGTMSVTDMLRDVTAENNAIATHSMHKIELLMTLYNIKNQYNY